MSYNIIVMKSVIQFLFFVLINIVTYKSYAQCSISISQAPPAPTCNGITLNSTFNGIQLPPNTGNIYLICDNNPWGSNIYDYAMDTIFGVGNWTKLTYANANPATIFSPATQFVYIEGSDNNALAQTAYLNANMSTIENWVFNGGRLLLNRAPNSGQAVTDFGFGGVTNNYLVPNNIAWGKVALGHPIGAGIYTPAGYNQINGSSFAHSIILGGNTLPIISQNGQHVLTEKAWGNGYVLFGGITAHIYHSPAENAKFIFRNYINYVANLPQGPAVSYVWQPGGYTTSSIVPPTTGIYTVTATQQGCTTTATYFAYINSTIVPGVTTSQGTITVNPTGGMPPYTYSLNGGNFVANNTFNYLCSGTYTLTVKDSYGNGCTADTIVNIVALNNFAGGAITPTINHPTCALSGNGSIYLNVAPPGTYYYMWSTGDTTSYIVNQNAGIFHVKITDANNSCVENTYTLTPIGNTCGNLTGNIYQDTNANCVKNITEKNIPNVMVIVNPGNYITYTDYFGNYSFTGLPFGNYTVTHDTSNATFYPNCGNNFPFSLSVVNVNETINFGDSCSTNTDYNIYLNSANCFVIPNPVKTRKITYKHNNPYYATSSATIYAVFDSINHYVSSSPTHASINGDTVFWNVNNIPYVSNMNISMHILVNFTFPNNYTPANTFPFKIGYYTTQYTDLNTMNNHVNYILSFCNGYDPNNKIVIPKGEGAQGYLNLNDPETKWLNYEINFQNTGNAPAYNIHITDTLSDKLDISKFQIINASHAYRLEVKNNQVLHWYFDNIMLPDSATNEPESHGQIKFIIKQKDDNVFGDVINNKVYIYFDNNPAIITNETINTLYMPEFTEEYLVNEQNTLVYPNPAGDALHILSKNTFKEVTIYDIQMRKVYDEKMNHTNACIIHLHQYKSGIYFLKIDNGKLIKFVVKS